VIFLFFLSFFHFIYVFKDKLKSENSKVLDNWPSLLEKLQSERDLARENAEYLSTLQEYFVVSIIDNNFSFFCPLLCMSSVVVLAKAAFKPRHKDFHTVSQKLEPAL
jgi:hypothetical protein